MLLIPAPISVLVLRLIGVRILILIASIARLIIVAPVLIRIILSLIGLILLIWLVLLLVLRLLILGLLELRLLVLPLLILGLPVLLLIGLLVLLLILWLLRISVLIGSLDRYILPGLGWSLLHRRRRILFLLPGRGEYLVAPIIGIGGGSIWCRISTAGHPIRARCRRGWCLRNGTGTLLGAIEFGARIFGRIWDRI